MTKLKQIYSILLAAYILTSLLVPLASFNKIIFLILLLIYGVYLLFFKKEDKFAWMKLTLAPVAIIFIFVYGFMRGAMNGADLVLARQFLFATSVFLLIYPIEEFEIDLNRLLKAIAKIYLFFFLVYAIYAINTLDYEIPLFIETFAGLFDNGITDAVGKILETYSGGWISYRSFFGGTGMMIYLGSVPFLMVLTDILFIDFLRNKKIGSLLWVFLAIVLSLTAGLRTLMLLIPISLCILLWLQLDNKKKLISAVLIGVIGTAAFLYLLNNSTFFSLSENSNSTKIGHLISYFDQLSVKNAVFGDGLASFYYSSGTEYALPHTEITFMDHCRYFGIPLAFAVWGMLLCPKISVLKDYWKSDKIGKFKEELTVFLLYLLFAQTNPVLFNSFGLISVLWYWNVFFCVRKAGNDKRVLIDES